MGSMASTTFRLLLVVLLAGVSFFVTPGAPNFVTPGAPKRDRVRSDGRPPMLVTLMHHHSTRGIGRHALPILEGARGKGTLAVMILELPRTMVPPDEVSLPDQPGGMGNVQPLSLGEAGTDGLWTGRLYRDQPEMFMTEEELRHLAAAGWELTFHGADHTPQSIIVDQAGGPAKLALAYAATAAEIRRILQDPTYPIATNTLASNGWSQAVREVAAEHFQWSEVAWRGSYQHVPVAYSSRLDPHGDLNSVAFQRDFFNAPDDIQELVRLARTGGGGWLIIQLHDVVDDLQDSPHPPTAMLAGEYRAMVESLTAAGVRFVTFAEGAAITQRDLAGNLLRNSFFGRHPFKERHPLSRLDWNSATAGGTDADIAYQDDGTLRFTSSQESRLTTIQKISSHLLQDRSYVLRLQADMAGVQAGRIWIRVLGPAGQRSQVVPAEGGEFCMEFAAREVAGSPAPPDPVDLSITAEQFTGTAGLGHLSLQELRSGVKSCRFTSRRPRR